MTVGCGANSPIHSSSIAMPQNLQMLNLIRRDLKQEKLFKKQKH